MTGKAEMLVLLRLAGSVDPEEDLTRFVRGWRAALRLSGHWHTSDAEALPPYQVVRQRAMRLVEHMGQAGVHRVPTRSELAVLLASEIPEVRTFGIRVVRK